ncbi:signal peptidase I [Aeromicrobium alkaliterrae]|uniref:Signal peptidase I n=1 Tax=Aeromicrobium alkaliterrae TaxID=302168 RepID=A0ABN2JIP7_9ACTN
MTRRAHAAPTLLGWAGQVIAWFVILGVLAVLCAAVLVPRVAGATPYTVLTGSMKPGMPPGTLVVVKPVDVDDIGVGDVITYQLESGRPTVVTHRVVGLGFDKNGDRIFQTQGDANSAPDAATVLPVQIRGERWYSVPHLGRLTTLVNGSERTILTGVVVVVLLGYAATMFVSAARDRREAAAPRRQARNKEEVP